MADITYRDGVFIAVLAVYVPALAIAIFLIVRHGFRNPIMSVWRLMAMFSLVRILAASFQLATIPQPNNTSLYAGYVTLIAIGASLIEIAALALLERVVSSMNPEGKGSNMTRVIKAARYITLIGLLLGIAGGVLTNIEWGNTGIYRPHPVSKASNAVFLASFATILAITTIVSLSIGRADKSGKRLFLAVALSLPFLLVRILYSAIMVFANLPSFNTIFGSVTILLCMALLEEIVIVVLYLAAGLSLPTKIEDSRKGAGAVDRV